MAIKILMKSFLVVVEQCSILIKRDSLSRIRDVSEEYAFFLVKYQLSQNLTLVINSIRLQHPSPTSALIDIFTLSSDLSTKVRLITEKDSNLQ